MGFRILFGGLLWAPGWFSYRPGPISESVFLWLCFCRQNLLVLGIGPRLTRVRCVTVCSETRPGDGRKPLAMTYPRSTDLEVQPYATVLDGDYGRFHGSGALVPCPLSRWRPGKAPDCHGPKKTDGVGPTLARSQGAGSSTAAQALLCALTHRPKQCRL